MLKKFSILAPIVFVTGLAILLIWLTKGHSVLLLEPKGSIALQQRNLLVFATILSLFVILPVFVLTIFIAWKYRATNHKADYAPDWDSNKKLELTWWGIPFAIIFVLSIVTWNTSHSLDPFKSISAANREMKVQVVALQWNWLFIYPEQNVATINYVKIPENTPIKFEITSDAPMNSFWIPQLGGQMYAMPGMTTSLHLIANETGTYQGSSANISGAGFSDMRFEAQAVTDNNFNEWIGQMKRGMNYLDAAAYARIAKPSPNMTKTAYAAVETELYDTIVMKYMAPAKINGTPKSDDKQNEGKHGHH